MSIHACLHSLFSRPRKIILFRRVKSATSHQSSNCPRNRPGFGKSCLSETVSRSYVPRVAVQAEFAPRDIILPVTDRVLTIIYTFTSNFVTGEYNTVTATANRNYFIRIKRPGKVPQVLGSRQICAGIMDENVRYVFTFEILSDSASLEAPFWFDYLLPSIKLLKISER